MKEICKELGFFSLFSFFLPPEICKQLGAFTHLEILMQKAIRTVTRGKCCCNPVSFPLNEDPEIYFLLVRFIPNHIHFYNYPREEEKRNYCAGFITGAILMSLHIRSVPCLCKNDKKAGQEFFIKMSFPREGKFA